MNAFTPPTSSILRLENGWLASEWSRCFTEKGEKCVQTRKVFCTTDLEIGISSSDDLIVPPVESSQKILLRRPEIQTRTNLFEKSRSPARSPEKVTSLCSIESQPNSKQDCLDQSECRPWTEEVDLLNSVSCSKLFLAGTRSDLCFDWVRII